jgi:hypothetical protein
MSGLDAAVSLLIALLNQSGRISATIATARAEGREEFTPEEWTEILDRDDAARALQVAALAKAKAQGR